MFDSEYPNVQYHSTALYVIKALSVCPFVRRGDGAARAVTKISDKMERRGSLPRNSCRAFPSCPIFFRLVVTYGAFRMEVSALILYLDLERWSREKGEEGWKQHETGERERERVDREEGGRVNTRRSAMVIMKASTKLETSSLLISSRPHVRGLHPARWRYPYLRDLGLRHIYLVRNVLCASTRTRDDDGFPRKSRISIRSDRHNSRPLYWRIYLSISKLTF